jgi:hypothetical protein
MFGLDAAVGEIENHFQYQASSPCTSTTVICVTGGRDFSVEDTTLVGEIPFTVQRVFLRGRVAASSAEVSPAEAGSAHDGRLRMARLKSCPDTNL